MVCLVKDIDHLLSVKVKYNIMLIVYNKFNNQNQLYLKKNYDNMHKNLILFKKPHIKKIEKKKFLGI